MIDPLWCNAFLLTLGVEVPLVVALAPRGRRRYFAGIAVGVQLLTHPLAWLAFTDGIMGWWTVEAAVVIVEAIVYAIASASPLRAFTMSLLANASSAAAGLWLLGK